MSTTHGLSHADLQEAAIEKDIEKLRQCESRVEELEAKLNETRIELEEAQASLASAKRAIEWKRLMAQVDADVDASKLTTDVDAATQSFCHSLQPPADYDDKEISYSDTDDYADLSAVDAVFEDATDEVRVRLQHNSAKTLASLSHRSSSTSPSGTPHLGASVHTPAVAQPLYDGCPDKKDAKAVARHSAMLLLLVLSVHAGHLERDCGLDSIRDPSNRPTGDLDELCESVASSWSWALNESNVLTHAERGYWQHVATAFLGPRFDPSPSS